MIKEIKKKQAKIGAVITYFDPANGEDLEYLTSLNSLSATTYIHTKVAGQQKAAVNGVQLVPHKSVPKLKSVVGHYISQFRVEGLVIFMPQTTRLLSDAEKVFQLLDSNRIERAFGFYCGPIENPWAIGVHASLIEHLYHSIPDALDMDGNWLGWLHLWTRKSLIGGRYFDGNNYFAVATVIDDKGAKLHPEVVAANPEAVEVITNSVTEPPKQKAPEDYSIGEQPAKPQPKKRGRKPKAKA